MIQVKAILHDYNIIEVKLSETFFDGQLLYALLNTDGKNVDLSTEKCIKTYKKDGWFSYTYQTAADIDFTKDLKVLVNNGYKAFVNVNRITKTKRFDKEFFYDKNDLGNTYSKEQTTFKIWAPTASDVSINIIHNDTHNIYYLNRGDKGVHSLTLKGDFEGASYQYAIKVNGIVQLANDPYAYSCTANGKRSYIVDLNKTNIDLHKDNLPVLERNVDAIIYELHVRDFSISETANFKNRAKFKAFSETNVKTKNNKLAGLDYIVDLGITHLQLLPIYDFSSVDEQDQFALYNWGYDPENYNMPEGSYITDCNDPYKRIIELKEMIATIHKKGIRVNMDVVYNHMFIKEQTSLDKIVPDYYFRFDENYELSNGSFCSNDVESRGMMASKYIVDSLKRWATFYGLDGFRFDLMGIIDTKTMNKAYKVLKEYDKNIMLYGEGWNMPTALKENEKSTIDNQANIPNIGHFNDKSRNLFKDVSLVDLSVKNNATKFFEDNLIQCMLGTSFKIDDVEPYIFKVDNSISYIECHDNHTYFDYLKYHCNVADNEIKVKHQFSTTLAFLSLGISFLHAGQEFYRTKQGIENSFMSNDDINKFDWDLKDKNQDYVDYIKEIIKIKKKYKSFDLTDNNLIKKHLNISTISDGIYRIESNYDKNKLVSYINLTNKNYELDNKEHATMLINSNTLETNKKITSNVTLNDHSYILFEA